MNNVVVLFIAILFIYLVYVVIKIFLVIVKYLIEDIVDKRIDKKLVMCTRCGDLDFVANTNFMSPESPRVHLKNCSNGTKKE